MRQAKYVYGFSEGSREMRELLGGKGANVAEMARLGPPIVVPAGFTVTTEACVAYLAADDGAFPAGLEGQIDDAVAALEARGRAGGSATRPTRCSSRSAPARASRCRG